MTRRLIVRPQVHDDVESAAAWYDRERQGLGNEFADQFWRVLNVVIDNPEQYQLIDACTRRAMLKRFP